MRCCDVFSSSIVCSVGVSSGPYFAILEGRSGAPLTALIAVEHIKRNPGNPG